jgi:hypothetical protein
VNADGNEVGGVQTPELVVPLATATGWNLRDPAIGFPDQLASFVGSYVPFAWTTAAREKSADPRPAVEERYANEANYLHRFQMAAEQAVKDRWMLAQDVPAALREAKREWQAVSRLAGAN